MRKIIVLLTAFSLVAISVMAQKVTYENNNLTFGAKVGVQVVSSLYNSNSNIKYTVTQKLFGGGYLNYKFSHLLSVQPEFLVGSEGAKYPDFVFKPLYFNLPLLAKFNLQQVGYNPNTSLGIYFGPQIGYLLSVSALEGIAYKDDNGKIVQPKELFKQTQISAIFGVEYEFKFRLNIGIRSQLGLSNIINSNKASVKSNLSAITIGYRF